MGVFPVFTGGVYVGLPPVDGVPPDDAKTHEHARIAMRDRETIFFINMYYTILNLCILQIKYDCQNILSP